MTLDAMRRPLAWGMMALAWGCIGYAVAGGAPGWTLAGAACVTLGLALMPPVKPTIWWEW